MYEERQSIEAEVLGLVSCASAVTRRKRGGDFFVRQDPGTDQPDSRGGRSVLFEVNGTENLRFF
ncbi:hypothetical protein R1flu_009825 [Riccia fluitans]|uniref:Uncharacterized protein n=1 Tax=Riccia fluitans TaxID=41844 RepID=A0ABD1Z383_9MARC